MLILLELCLKYIKWIIHNVHKIPITSSLYHKLQFIKSFHIKKKNIYKRPRKLK